MGAWRLRKTGLGFGGQATATKKRPTVNQETKTATPIVAGARSFSSLILIINFIFLLYDTCSLSSLPISFVFRIIVFHLWAAWRCAVNLMVGCDCRAPFELKFRIFRFLTFNQSIDEWKGKSYPPP